MSELTFNLLRLGYLLLLWVFVLSAVAILRRDISVRGQASYSRQDQVSLPMEPQHLSPWVPPAEASVGTQPVGTPPIGAPPGPEPIVVGPGAAAAPSPEPIIVGPGATSGSASSGPKPPKYLAITSGALAGSMLPLTSLPITIGRAPSNTLVIEDDYASSHHARIYPTTQGWIVEDLNSTNGTFIDGAQLTGAAILTPEVPVTIGHSTVKLVV